VKDQSWAGRSEHIPDAGFEKVSNPKRKEKGKCRSVRASKEEI
jgi:hypothetical protein